MFEEKKLENFIAGIGSMAEIQILYYNTLVSNGIDEDIAVKMSSAFLKNILEIGLASNGA